MKENCFLSRSINQVSRLADSPLPISGNESGDYLNKIPEYTKGLPVREAFCMVDIENIRKSVIAGGRTGAAGTGTG
jgi:hypothetical protein